MIDTHNDIFKSGRSIHVRKGKEDRLKQLNNAAGK